MNQPDNQSNWAAADKNRANFQYCPRCGSRSLYLRDTKKYQCEKCQFKFYFNTAAAVIALIVNAKEELLITVRKHDPAGGAWDLPGGFVDYRESAEAALQREIKEELDLEILASRYLFSLPNTYEFAGVVYSTVDLVFACQVANLEQVKAQDDVQEVMFKPKEELKPEKFGLQSAKKVIAWYLSDR